MNESYIRRLMTVCLIGVTAGVAFAIAVTQLLTN